MNRYSIILSIDLAEEEAVLDLCRKTSEFIDGVKIGITSSMVPGTSIFSRVKEILNFQGSNKPVLADYKIADIGFNKNGTGWSGTNEKIISRLADAGVDYITCHLFPGLSSIEEASAVAGEKGCKILTLPFMTHAGADLFFGLPLGKDQRDHIQKVIEKYGKNNKMPVSVSTITEAILFLGDQYGTDGFIGPGNNPEILRTYRQWTDKEIWCPGFGRQDHLGRNLSTQIKEWADICGPQSAMIVGSYIYNADDPAAAAAEVREIRDRETQ
jgi:orotidine 5'-phosphate decarboxylase subfamily 1